MDKLARLIGIFLVMLVGVICLTNVGVASGEANLEYLLSAKWTGFHGPHGLASDGENIYVADSGNDRVQKLSSNGTLLASWGSQGTGDGQFNGPIGVAVDDEGNVYVTDYWNNRIQKFTSSGVFITSWSSYQASDEPNVTQTGVLGIVVDASGNVYVSNQRMNRVQKFSREGVLVKSWGSEGSGDGQFNSPEGVAIDGSNNVYVADEGNNRVQIFDSEGVFIGKWGKSGSGDEYMFTPQFIATDTKGDVYVTDLHNRCVQKFTAEGAFITKWGNMGLGDTLFNFVAGIAVDDEGNVFVSDASYGTIQRFTLGPAPVRCDLTVMVIDEVSVPVKRAEVSTEITPQWQSDWILYTDEEGKVVFSGILPGNYTIKATRDEVSNMSSTKVIAGASNTLTLRLKIRVPVVGFLNINLYDHSTENPVEGARVRTTSVPAGQAPLEGLTDSDGKISWSGLIPGRYEIMITKQGYEDFPTDYDVEADSDMSAYISMSRIGLDHFVFDTVSSQVNGTAFTISIKAVDRSGNVYTGYNGSNTLSVSMGSITPDNAGPFVNGVWSGAVILSMPGSGVRISTVGGDRSGQSNEFEVKQLSPTVSPTPSPTPGGSGGGGIPGFPYESMILGIVLGIILLWIVHRKH